MTYMFSKVVAEPETKSWQNRLRKNPGEPAGMIRVRLKVNIKIFKALKHQIVLVDTSYCKA